MKKLKYDLTGKRFGRLVVLEFIGTDGHRFALWKCKCDCGNIHIVESRSLRVKDTKSCGCLQRERARFVNRIEVGESAFNRVCKNYRKSAELRNLEFKLTKEDIRLLTKRMCYYCGQEPRTISVTDRGNGSYIYNGIDRMDNTKGYILSNCVTCCETCNRAKLKMSKEDFLSWISRVYKHSIEEFSCELK